jgi:uncharacterized protein
LRLKVKVIPGAPKNQILGLRGEELVIKVAEAPERGKANQELVKFLAATLGCRKNEIGLLSGETSHHKVIELADDLGRRLLG